MVSKIPLDLQQVICKYATDFNGDSSFIKVAITVCNSSSTVTLAPLEIDAQYLENRHYRIKNYLTFISFVKTVTSPNPILPYGSFIKSIDLTPVNKYGIDMRASKLVKCCPNIVEMTLGHPTTLKTETIQEITKYNTKLHTLWMGGIDSYPFMLDCDFSGLSQLQHVTLKTTPLLISALMTLPQKKLKSMKLIQMDAITPQELLDFCRSHPRLQSLTIVNCRNLFNAELGYTLAKLLTPHHPAACLELMQIELEGLLINDKQLFDLFNIVPKGTKLKKLKLSDTSITADFIKPILCDDSTVPLKVAQIELQNNRFSS
ncbi:hypothetical protein [Parasitella parasitica]|uniref:F-box domain-containing protein n=1 Tax=Parasitella parasitica TaxID=35722 RepID=A0A0B7NA84_9FUNG|nr:hypothetical protein [Parasitella parasitica]